MRFLDLVRSPKVLVASGINLWRSRPRALSRFVFKKEVYMINYKYDSKGAAAHFNFSKALCYFPQPVCVFTIHPSRVMHSFIKRFVFCILFLAKGITRKLFMFPDGFAVNTHNKCAHGSDTDCRWLLIRKWPSLVRHFVYFKRQLYETFRFYPDSFFFPFIMRR